MNPVGDDRKYVEAFLRTWNAEKLTSPPASAASSPETVKTRCGTEASVDPVIDDSKAFQPVVSSSASATFREWSDSAGKFKLTAKLASVKVGDLPVTLPESLGSTVKVELTNKDGKTVAVSYSHSPKRIRGSLRRSCLRSRRPVKRNLRNNGWKAEAKDGRTRADT